MDSKEDSPRQESCQESVRGTVVDQGYVCLPLPPPPRGRVCFLGINPHRTRKEPEQRLLKRLLKTYCVLCPGLATGQGEA